MIELALAFCALRFEVLEKLHILLAHSPPPAILRGGLYLCDRRSGFSTQARSLDFKSEPWMRGLQDAHRNNITEPRGGAFFSAVGYGAWERFVYWPLEWMGVGGGFRAHTSSN
jgi:hypothetical protein